MWQAQARLLNLAFVLGGLLSVTAVSVAGVEANLQEDTAAAGDSAGTAPAGDSSGGGAEGES